MELQTISEMANILKVKKSWMYSKTRLKGSDTIPMVRVGKHLRFNPNDMLWRGSMIISQRMFKFYFFKRLNFRGQNFKITDAGRAWFDAKVALDEHARIPKSF